MTKPVAVFLHGLLGDKHDWQAVCAHLRIDSICLDLPGHGDHRHINVDSFFDVACWLDNALKPYYNRPLILIGYSLGARIALYYSYAFLPTSRQPHLLVLEGANMGLPEATQRQLRWEHDQQWADYFRQHSMTQSLMGWYQQEVFAHLTDSQRHALIATRGSNDPHAIAKMLLATSLAKQPYLLDCARQSPFPVHYICGERDKKFRQLVKEYALRTHFIDHAGHNAHRENPAAFAAALTALLQPFL
ncbi:2-succinyl-6-hydroxy-2,4-cyclohexadiene-1-carboxylate synthase [Spirabiliibacterium falconis]|uniref:2-succinyl-6-hydroxy-2, 4-cyclohexadiene-1-carboxylate synthase n=1 Tax=Spirabiliibacterium falconis TaxID=572023 RepID=UPI001AAD4993|nr:2-succinyl-6-hydroxy-2,4-cyclohexadiene-1-carboxylate synthase [Spirabiliibacterium falconis]MBE2893529.1 2-succinyl-6-hydroxy-2,4-cyclohexadiene-1-carboxylate synthase [Spirabiliibacterium falconis]